MENISEDSKLKKLGENVVYEQDNISAILLYKRMEEDIVPSVQNISTANTFILLTVLIAEMCK